MAADLVAVFGDPGIDAHLEVLAEQRVGTGHGPDDADLDHVGRGRAGYQAQEGECKNRLAVSDHHWSPVLVTKFRQTCIQ
ncbi:hypothetical protein ONR75_09175 [Rhodopseudomonas sp. P2A-2r]|uniref:hypothetical protein n=1 Tax=Rhodopseudomonas sp. P2A-2r TaxID=2991972 RepID=UPI00223450F0|nr:hypothetical protein [Rhodopseudomonas sp. P2A-2r]UZE52421.1 hypothetical protein ONR75_09175 [Rhodopseudomonas sp. P2A-2r]